MNIIARLIKGKAVDQLRDRLAARDRVNAKLAAFAQRASAATADVEARRVKFFETLDESEFAAWASARRDLAALVECGHEVSRHLGFKADQTIETDEVRELLLDALRDSAATLAREVNRVAAEEQKRLAEAGVEDAGEHPALVKVRARINELSECHGDLTERMSVESWRPYRAKYLAALNLP